MLLSIVGPSGYNEWGICVEKKVGFEVADDA